MIKKSELFLELIETYQDLIKFFDDNGVLQEKGFLVAMRETEIWNEMPDIEKEAFRKNHFILLRDKIIGNKNDSLVLYYESIINLYDRIVVTMHTLKNNHILNKENLLKRVFTICVLEKNLINRNKDIRVINHIFPEMAENIFNLLKKESLYNFEFQNLEKAFYNMYDCQNRYHTTNKNL